MSQYTEVSINEIQQSSDMMIGEGYNLGSNAVSSYGSIPGFKQTTNFRPKYANQKHEKKKGKIAKFFSNMSRLGMNYDEDVINNLRALPADKNLLPKNEQLQNQDLFSQLSSAWKTKQNADKNFFEKDFAQKRDALRKLALQPELEDILDTMSNEAIVYDRGGKWSIIPTPKKTSWPGTASLPTIRSWLWRRPVTALPRTF